MNQMFFVINGIDFCQGCFQHFPTIYLMIIRDDEIARTIQRLIRKIYIFAAIFNRYYANFLLLICMRHTCMYMQYLL